MALHENTIEFLASRKARIHHYLWHQLRNTWENGINDKQKMKIGDLGWAPPNSATDKNGRWIHDNGSGEDFLFMHRQMIDVVKEMQFTNNASVDTVKGWQSIPGPISAEYPVPPTWEVDGNPGLSLTLKMRKSDEYYYSNILEWQNMFTDSTWLKGKTLTEVGSRIESTVHNVMHLRWAERPWDPRTGRQEDTFGRPDGNFDKKWDDSRADFLANEYSSHIPAVFWKLHGWVDDRIDDWYEANKCSLERVKLRGVDWFEGELVTNADPWSGGMDFTDPSHTSHHHSGHGNHAMPEDPMLTKMEKVLKALDDSSRVYHFYDL